VKNISLTEIAEFTEFLNFLCCLCKRKHPPSRIQYPAFCHLYQYEGYHPSREKKADGLSNDSEEPVKEIAFMEAGGKPLDARHPKPGTRPKGGESAGGGQISRNEAYNRSTPQ
jgi:hypothetical protein